MRYQLSSDRPAFTEYDPSLRSLEQSLKRAGLPIRFLAWVHPNLGKVICIKVKRESVISVCIEGDSPVQALKDVVAGINQDLMDAVA
ncbi:MAG: hypothetical protein LBQ38_07180 [Spirochaetaceae bacterium]|jgi:hypothetical protein|nr:hypothetical protein [Spirochaetaceae bacterium]